jgi:hypothetical protein
MRCRCTGGAKANSDERIKTVSPKMATIKREMATIGDVCGMVAMPMIREE